MLLCASERPAAGCPFCDATSQTLSEEIAAADVVVLAELGASTGGEDPSDGGGEAADPTDSDPTDSAPVNDDYGNATFRIVKVLHGADLLDGADDLQAVYFGSDQPARQFMITGIRALLGDELQLDWATPLPLTPEAVEYVEQLDALPMQGIERYRFFLKYFENSDPLLAQDAYDEFARVPYDQVVAMADILDREKLIRWINDPQVSPTHRRLCLTMLGVCGGEEDISMLENLLRYDDRQIQPGLVAMVSTASLSAPAFALPVIDELVGAEQRRKMQCLDALVACYLKLKGAGGLPLVEERFLKNPDAEYSHIYSTVMALRFHGESTDVIPRERLLRSFRLLLDNPEMADQIIADLARWEDWEVMDRLVAMFKASDEGIGSVSRSFLIWSSPPSSPAKWASGQTERSTS